MKTNQRAKGCWLWAAIFVVAFGLPAFLSWNFLVAPMLDYQTRFKGIVGEPRAGVIAEFGEPKFRLSKEQVQAGGIDYPWRASNYRPVPKRPVGREVLLYKHMDRAVYVFIGEDDKVEATEFAALDPEGK